MYYDVIDSVFVGNKHRINDVIMTSRSFHVTIISFPYLWYQSRPMKQVDKCTLRQRNKSCLTAHYYTILAVADP